MDEERHLRTGDKIAAASVVLIRGSGVLTVSYRERGGGMDEGGYLRTSNKITAASVVLIRGRGVGG